MELRTPQCDLVGMAPSPVPDDLVARWQDTLSQWTHKLAHNTVLGCAVKHNQLAWLATRYRESARANPFDPIARDRLKGVQRAATLLAFSASATHDEPRRSRGGPALLAAAILSTCLALWLTDYVRLHNPHPVMSSHDAPSSSR
jgi:hypothetical protein